MRSREILLLVGATTALGLAGLAAFGADALAGTQEPVPAAPSDPAGPTADLAALPLPDHAPLAPAAAAAAPEAPRIDTSGWSKGVVKGDIQLATSVLGQLGSLRVEVTEMRRPGRGADGVFSHPHKLVVPVAITRGTPTFEVHDVPFSEYPYVVSVHAPGLNGSTRTITVDRDHPLTDDVMLRISPGAPVSVLVRDQDRLPWVGVEVTLVPVGQASDRSAQKGTTDNAGSLVFDSVLAGEWEVHVQRDGLPLQTPYTTTVSPGSMTTPLGQSLPIVIERGVPLQVVVRDRANYPHIGAKVTATATDRVKLTMLETTTNELGIAAFARLQPGTWQLTATKDGFHLWDKQVTVQAFQDPVAVDAVLVPVR